MEKQIAKLHQGITRLIDGYAEGYLDKAEVEPTLKRENLSYSSLFFIIDITEINKFLTVICIPSPYSTNILS